MRILKAGVLYFALVFGSGFVLGIVRTIWVVPWLGMRAAELAETPIMMAITVVAARFVVRWLAVPPVTSVRLAIGGLAFGLALAAEFGAVLGIRGQSIREYFATRDPVSGTVFYAVLVLYALMPLLVGRD